MQELPPKTPRASDLQAYVQRNHFSAIKNDTPPHRIITASGTHCEPRLEPCRIMARNASFSAVSGRALISGWTIFGKRSYEKKTPEKIHIGIMTRLMRPLTLSIFCARLAVSSPTPPKVSDPIAAINAIEPTDPSTRM